MTREYERAYGRTVLPDRSHNALLDVGLAGGVPALAIFGTLLVIVVVRSWRVARHGEPIVAGVAVGLVAAVIQQQFLFPLAEVDPIFWLLAGAVVATARPPRPWSVELPRAAAAVPVLALAVAMVLGGRELAADRHVHDALDRLGAGDAPRAVAEAHAAARLRPDVLRVELAVARAESASGTVGGAERALAALDRALGWSPRDPIVRRERAELLTTIAEADGDPGSADRAFDAWRRLADGDPNNAAVRLGLGLAAADAGDRPAAEAAWRDAADLAPTSSAPLVNLTRLLVAEGRIEDALTALAEAEARAPHDPAVVRLRAELGPG